MAPCNRERKKRKKRNKQRNIGSIQDDTRLQGIEVSTTLDSKTCYEEADLLDKSKIDTKCELTVG